MGSLIRIISFYNKWLADVVREPSQLASLVLGPFLILLLFGAGTQVGAVPKPRAIVVDLGEQGADSPLAVDSKDVSQYLDIVQRTPDLDAAMGALARHSVDLVAVLPPNPAQTIMGGERAKIRIFTNEIDPLRDSYAKAYLYYQISTLNQAAVARAIADAQRAAGQVDQLAGQARRYLASAKTARDDVQTARRELSQLRAQLDPLADALTDAAAIADNLQRFWPPGSREPLERIRTAARTVAEMRARLDQYEARLAAGGGAPSAAELDELERSLGQIEGSTKMLSAVPPEVLSAPFELQLENVAPFALSTIGFYAPAVLALLLQHLAVTLGALSMARVRLLGLMEILQASPLRPIEATIGNYLSYGTLCIIAGGALVALLVGLLGVPIFGAPALFAVTLLLLVFCSLGIGFVIAMLAPSEQQASQITMLVLIASVFFSGFMIFLESIDWPIRAVSYLLPATYAIQTLRDIMLRGALLSPIDLYVLGAAGIVFFIATVLLYRREFRPK
jgi:ABC-2 type transport system permease protein